jgi:hypothetical protein
MRIVGKHLKADHYSLHIETKLIFTAHIKISFLFAHLKEICQVWEDNVKMVLRGICYDNINGNGTGSRGGSL